ncbi:aldose reductase-like isoform X1 [Cimex lectularius]|uniref:NADP-dependent oxidoreductase domain-containing protein n=1 Tax=Cimex lectularius TaxID=79782 RepID=A0A8I6TJK7_CIMLE|nr:aldose reductase-like isoform X1 [Cimex lectularius]
MSACLKLNNGFTIPTLGLGTWNALPGVVSQAVKDAIDIGYRHFDCAYIYGNEKEVGEGLRAKLEEGKVKREDLFVTTKLWNTFHKKELVEGALRTSLQNLALDYVDLYLIHWPMGFKEGGDLMPKENEKLLYSDTPYTETWKAMEECVNKGLVRSIGLSNFNKRQIEDVLKVATIKPVTNQVECHPYLNQQALKDFCTSHGILLTAYSPLGSPQNPLNLENYLIVLNEPLLKQIGEKYGKTPGQVLIRYQIERGNVVIPKSVNKSRIQQNFDVFDFQLNKDDMDQLNDLNRKDGRLLVLAHIADHKYYPFNDAF